MLSHKTSSALPAVSDRDRGRAFHGTTPGLPAAEDAGDVAVLPLTGMPGRQAGAGR